ncbi:MAG: hypothetical protein RM049_33335 [Nostoc sp. DedQUE04]|nr:hypothetical protein [Nostoc sp. DedQUE04]MDZ8140121.1 hypothetical protein [Nostoc sp. DedQUE04]
MILLLRNRATAQQIEQMRNCSQVLHQNSSRYRASGAGWWWRSAR